MSNLVTAMAKARQVGISRLTVFSVLLGAAVFGYAVGVLFWSWLLMLGAGDGGLDWSYGWTATHWGLLVPFVMSFVFRRRSA